MHDPAEAHLTEQILNYIRPLDDEIAELKKELKEVRALAQAAMDKPSGGNSYGHNY